MGLPNFPEKYKDQRGIFIEDHEIKQILQVLGFGDHNERGLGFEKLGSK